MTLIAACTWWTDVGNRKCHGDGRGDRETREAPLRLIWGGRCHGSAFRTATAVLDPRASTLPKKYHGITIVYHGNTMVYHGFTMVYHGAPWYTMVQLLVTMVYHGCHHGIPWYYHGTNIIYRGIPWYIATMTEAF